MKVGFLMRKRNIFGFVGSVVKKLSILCAESVTLSSSSAL